MHRGKKVNTQTADNRTKIDFMLQKYKLHEAASLSHHHRIV